MFFFSFYFKNEEKIVNSPGFKPGAIDNDGLENELTDDKGTLLLN
jgi:hypothetical protein